MQLFVVFLCNVVSFTKSFRVSPILSLIFISYIYDQLSAGYD